MDIHKPPTFFHRKTSVNSSSYRFFIFWWTDTICCVLMSIRIVIIRDVADITNRTNCLIKNLKEVVSLPQKRDLDERW
jgi:hypothetical protein